MEPLRWLRSILQCFVRAKDTTLRRLFTILRLLLHWTHRPKPPSDKGISSSNASQSCSPIGNTLVICPSEIPSLTPYATDREASKSVHEIARPTRLDVGPVPRRSRSATPSRPSPMSTPPSPLVMEPSPIGDEHSAFLRPPSMAPSMTSAGTKLNLESFPDLDLSRRTLRHGTPSATSIRSRLGDNHSIAHSALWRQSWQDATPPQASTGTPNAAVSPLPHTHCTPAISERPALALSAQNPAFWPIAPESLMRYDRIEQSLIESAVTEHEIPAFTKDPKLDHGHDEWEAYIHPEGARYYKHKTKAEIITRLLQELEEYANDNAIVIAPTTDLVLDLVRDEVDNVSCDYYFADHHLRSVFWLDAFQADSFYIWSEVKGVTSHAQVAHIIESQYWFHCQLYPTAWPLSIDSVDDLRDMLLYAIGDVITSPLSTAPFKLADLQQILSLANSIRKNVSSGHPTTRPGMTSSLARFMYLFVRQRFIHFHGEPNARLERDKSVYKNHQADIRRTLLITVLSPILFFAPDVHVRSIQKIWVDGIINDAVFGSFIEKLTNEWQEFILFGTVLLNANVAFLAIQSVDEGTANPHRSAAQLASYLSVVTVMGSIIIGLLLVRQNRSKVKESSAEALQFMNSQKHNMLGAETLAIVYSLPYALLMWAVVAFLAAFTLMCILHSSLAVRLIVGIAWGTIGALILWCILISWELIQRNQRWFMLLIPGFLREGWPQWVEVVKPKLKQLPDPWRPWLKSSQERAYLRETLNPRAYAATFQSPAEFQRGGDDRPIIPEFTKNPRLLDDERM
ncbi:hypothetical protein CYLTODRAFT_411681 [Cylindrobasidium torrendii FP15055 ss-10]|uniref:WW domain-containing protein n=1 Tax=Cylindrobasidium torrendii FP15055 ss-10 TaxID=1314674 RepID=A0A0D7B908_9AGAR|nr:hypothetical protein CYLTODRAFT_411681 [Cylindrobasidium torrendii FP15055 ss-10]